MYYKSADAMEDDFKIFYCTVHLIQNLEPNSLPALAMTIYYLTLH